MSCRLGFVSVKRRALSSKLFKDSFWSIIGNGFGNACFLLSGIIIARYLGKDIYGEYGLVKTTMFYVAAFASFGLGLTSTKYIADFINGKKEYISSIVTDSLEITLLFSALIAIILILFSNTIANYLDAPSLSLALKYLAGIVVLKAISTTIIGLLSGLKKFKQSGIINIVSGVFMLVTCVPLTYFWGLRGALGSLFASQLLGTFIYYLYLKKEVRSLCNQTKKSFKLELLYFSFPVALQELSYTLCNWAAIIFLTKYSTTGELGLYSAAAQWNAIVLMIPGLLGNVVLSHLSSCVGNNNHNRTLVKMLLINFVCTFIPFLIVYILSNFISSFYGPTFADLPTILRVLTFCAIFECCSSVFKSEFLAEGSTWLLFSVRTVRDVLLLGFTFYLLKYTDASNHGALCFSWITVVSNIVFFGLLVAIYLARNENNRIIK